MTKHHCAKYLGMNLHEYGLVHLAMQPFVHKMMYCVFLIFVDNLESKYLKKDEVSPGVKAGTYQGEVRSDISTSFFILLAIFFPSVTGTLATVNVELNCYLHLGLAQLWKIVLGFLIPLFMIGCLTPA